jgi:hypothetical protein
MTPAERYFLGLECEPWKREGIAPPAKCAALDEPDDEQHIELAARIMAGETVALPAPDPFDPIECAARAMLGETVALAAGELMKTRLHIIDANSHLTADGSGVRLGGADLAATAKAYDPGRHMAMLFIGHPKDSDPAYGYVLSLEAVRGDLYANVYAGSPLVDGVRGGRYRKISPSFWSPKHPENPAPGFWSLRHIGFFGGTAAEESGLDPIERAARIMAGLS